jgi:hypothetical protein
MQLTQAERNALIDRITNAVDKFVRDGGGTYDELQAIVERAVDAVLESEV